MRTIAFVRAALIAAAVFGVSETLGAERGRGFERDQEGLWMLVERHEQELRTSNRIVRDEVLESRLKDLTCRAVGATCNNLRVYVIRVPGFNAFMLPNGAMFVQSGLLLRIGDDAELAAVLGHETSHFTRKHSVQSMRRWYRTSSGFAIASVLIAAAGTVAASSSNSYEGALAARDLSDTAQAMLSAASVFAAFQLVAYDRNQEREADLDGIGWMIARGLDPHGAPRIWQKVASEQEAGGRNSGFSILATHPAPRTRLAYLSEIAGTKRQAPSQNTDVEATRSIAGKTIPPLVDPYRQDWIADEMESQHPTQFEAITRAQERFGLSPGFTNYLVGKSWATHARSLRGRKVQRALGRAAAAFERAAIIEHGMPAEGFREWGKVNIALEDMESASRNFHRYLALAPDAWDARYVRRQIERLGAKDN